MAKSNKSEKPGTTFNNFLLNASPKDKAIVYCIKYDDRRKNFVEPLITEEQAKALLDSIFSDEKKKRIFDKWIRYYLTIRKASQWFTYMYSEFISNFRRIERDYVYIGGLIRNEAQYNRLIREAKDREGESASHILRDMILNITPPPVKAKIELDPDYLQGIKINASKFIKEDLKKDMKYYLKDYSRLKSFIIAFNQYTKEKAITELIPPTIREYISDVERNEITSLFVEPFSRRKIQGLKEEGKFIAQMREESGILPDYEDIEAPEEQVNYWLENIEKEYQILLEGDERG